MKRLQSVITELFKRPCWKPDTSAFWRGLFGWQSASPNRSPEIWPSERLVVKASLPEDVDFIEIQTEDDSCGSRSVARVAVLAVKPADSNPADFGMCSNMRKRSKQGGEYES